MTEIPAKRKRADGACDEPDGDGVGSETLWVEDHGGCVEVQCEDDSLEDEETAEELVARQRQALLDVSLLKLCRPPQRSELGLQRHILISSVIRRIHDDIRQEAGVMYVVQASPVNPVSYYLVPALLLEEPPDSDAPPVLNPSPSPSLFDDATQEGWSSHTERCQSPPMTDYVLDDVLPTDASLYDPPAVKCSAGLPVRPLVATSEEQVLL